MNSGAYGFKHHLGLWFGSSWSRLSGFLLGGSVYRYMSTCGACGARQLGGGRGRGLLLLSTSMNLPCVCAFSGPTVLINNFNAAESKMKYSYTMRSCTWANRRTLWN